MLSILIPTYNYDCSSLVYDLDTMCSRAGIEYEIIVGNDGSTTNMQNLKNLSQTLENFRFLDFKENRGRSIIRNTLASEAKYEKLLFIDSDMKVYKTDFILLYIKENAPIVAGGIRVLEDKNPIYILHKKYEKNRSTNIATTGNLLVRKDVFNEIRFIESVKKYGYEDIIFTHRLEKMYGIKFIYNPLIHNGPIPTCDFINRLNESTEVLVELYRSDKYHKDIIESSKLLRTFLKIRRFKGIYLLWFKMSKRIIIQQLKSKNPSMFLMDLYKLGLLCEYSKISLKKTQKQKTSMS